MLITPDPSPLRPMDRKDCPVFKSDASPGPLAFPATSLPVSGLNSFNPRHEEVRQSYRRLRQSSIAASLFDPMSARDVMRKSYSSLADLGKDKSNAIFI